MKKIITSLVLVGTLATAGGFAQVGAAYSRGVNESDNGTAFVGLNVLGDIGLRLEYSKNFSENPELSNEDISRYGLFATYTLPITPSFSITPKAGMVKSDGSFTVKDSLEKVSDSSTTFTYGLEVNYQLNRAISMFVGYTDYGNKFESIGDVDASEFDSQNYTFGIKIDL